jgi:hypothetical protein
MTVRELIEKLRECNPDAEVCTEYEGAYLPAEIFMLLRNAWPGDDSETCHPSDAARVVID